MGDAADERRNYYRVMEIGRRLLNVSRRILAGHYDRRADDWPHRDTACDFNGRAEVLECVRIEHRSLLTTQIEELLARESQDARLRRSCSDS